MQKYWNFRQILEVYEDPYDVSCVGTAKTVWPPRRCENSIAVYDRVEAGRLLDEMDRHKRLSSSTKSLQELAALLLCKGVHNHLSRPHLSQVVEMSNKWRERVRSYDSMIKKEQEDAAFKTEKALSILKVRAEEIMAKLEEDNLDNTQITKPGKLKAKETCKIDETHLESYSPVKESSFYDPFIYHDDRRQNDLEKASKATQKALKTNNTIRDSSSRQSISVSLEDNTFKVGEYILPSPPQHKPGLSLPKGTPLTLQGRNTQQRREEEAAISPTKLANFTTEQDTLTVTKASSFSRTKKANFAVKFGSQDKSEFKSFEFELPTTPSKPPPSIGTSTTKITTNHPSSSSPKANPQLPGFDFAYNANSASLILGSEEPPAVVDGDPAESSQQLPVFEFGVQYTTPPKTFDFDIPSKHSYPMRLAERPSSIWENNDIGPKERYSARPGNRVDDEKLDFSESTQQVEQEAISEALVETAPIRLEEDPITPNDIPNIECLLPQTPVCKRKEETDEEPFGYAIVTPSSSSYKTYLPARQQHGLLTPPETPETQRHLCNKSTTSARATDFFDSPVSRISSNDSSTIARKPLPNLKDSRPLDDTTPPTDETELVPIAEVCSACGNDKGFEERGCPCCEVSGNEKDQTGCLHSLNLRRLRRLVERRINAGMRRVSCRIESRE